MATATAELVNGKAETITPQFFDDLKAESDLRRMRIDCGISRVPLSQVNWKESQLNGARAGGAILNDKVEDYMQGFRNGDAFPRAVLIKTATGYVILSGNQRGEALRRLRENGEIASDFLWEVYEVDSSSDRTFTDVFARAANASHGAGMTKDERMQQAMYFVRNDILDIKQASLWFSVSPNGLSTRLRGEEVRTSFRRQGVDLDHVATSTIIPLLSIDYDSASQRKLASLISQYNPTADTVRQVVAEIDKHGDQKSRMDVVVNWACDLKAARGSKKIKDIRIPKKPRRDKIFRLCAPLAQYLQTGNGGEPIRRLEETQITTKADTQALLELCKPIRYTLGVLFK